MQKEKQGIVIEISNNISKVKEIKHGDCENCGSCAGSNAMVVDVNNQVGAKIGDKVIFEFKQDNILKAAFIIYVLPLAAIFIGAMLGGMGSELVDINKTMFQVIGGIICFFIAVVFIIYYEKKSKADINKLPKIKRVL